MARAKTFLWLSRCCLTIISSAVAILVFGPFGGAEQQFGLSDKEAHALAFYVLSTLGLMAMPRIRKWDIALVCIAIGGAIEIVQTFVGRDGDIFDWLADTLGVFMAVVPMAFENVRGKLRGSNVTVSRCRRGLAYNLARRPDRSV